jgi:pentatricopeptide repeat protein
MVLYLCMLIVFSLHRELLKLILAMNPLPEVILSNKFHYRMNSECFSANINAFGVERYIVLAEKAFVCCLRRKMPSVSVCNVMIKAYGLVEKLDAACEIADGMEMHEILPNYLQF